MARTLDGFIIIYSVFSSTPFFCKIKEQMLEYFVDTFSVCSGQKENGNTYDVVKHSAFSDDPLEELF